jgi:hypothetical protein
MRYLVLLSAFALLCCVGRPKEKHTPRLPDHAWLDDNGQNIYVIRHQIVAWIRHVPASQSLWGVEFDRLPEFRYFDNKEAARQYVEERCRKTNCLPSLP